MTDDELNRHIDSKRAVFYMAVSDTDVDMAIKGKPQEIITLIGMGIAEFIKKSGFDTEKLGEALNRIVKKELEGKYGA